MSKTQTTREEEIAELDAAMQTLKKAIFDELGWLEYPLRFLTRLIYHYERVREWKW